MKKILLSILLICMFSGCANLLTLTNSQAMMYTLPNGLQVVLQENHSSPVLSSQVWVKVGSIHETDDIAGIAHVHEHMLFKGTEDFGLGEISQAVEAAGGDINAYTTYDRTVYYINMASRFAEKSLHVLSQAVFHSLFDEEELAKEIEVVVEEINRQQDNPDARTFLNFMNTAYTKHPHKRPVIGYTDVVRSFDREKLTNFYKTWYTPENMTLVIEGDFKTEEMKGLIEKYFGSAPKKAAPKSTFQKEPKQTEAKIILEEDQIEDTYLTMGFHSTDALHPDSPALDVLASILSHSRSSRLDQKLREELQLVRSISAYNYSPLEPGFFGIEANLTPENLEPAIAHTAKTLSEVLNEMITQEELERAKTLIRTDHLRGMETVQGRADELGSSVVFGGDPNFMKTYYKKMDQVTAEQVQEVGRRYLTKENVTISIRTKKGKSPIKKDVLLNAFTENLQIDSIKKPENTGDQTTQKYVFNNGLTILATPQKNAATIGLTATFIAGARMENASNNGIGELIEETWDRGSKNYQTKEIDRMLDQIGARISSGYGRNAAKLSSSFTPESTDDVLPLFTDLLLNPTFPEEELEKAKKRTLERIATQKDNLSQYTFTQFRKELFQKHPYGLNPLGTPATIKKIKQKDLGKFYQTFANPDNLVISIAGNFDEEKVLNYLSTRLGTLEKASTKEIETPEEKNRPASTTHVKTSKEQTHIVIGMLGPTISDADKSPLEVLNIILGNMGGRFFLELRDKESLAYTVFARNTLGIDPQENFAYIATSPEKVEQALTGLHRELEKVRTELVTEEELSRAQNYLIGTYELGLQTPMALSGITGSSEILGLGYDYYKSYPKRVESVTREDIKRVAQTYFDPELLQTFIYGSKK